MSKNVKVNDEQFTVSKPTNCAMQIKHDRTGMTATVTVKGSSYVIQTSGKSDNGQLNGPSTDPVVAACTRILGFAPEATKALCDKLSASYEKLT